MDQLSRIRQANQLEARLGKLPKTLNAAYEEIFQGIEDGDRQILERAVKWVLCASFPLTTSLILDAVRLSVSSDGTTLMMDPIIAEETFLDICGHLIVKDSESKRWKFPHASVIEYFEEVHQWSLERAHSFVAEICLLYLLDDSTITWKTPEDKPRVLDEVYDVWEENLTEYVLRQWFQHVSALEKPDPHEAEVSSLLQQFLGIDKSPPQSSQQYRRWFEHAFRLDDKQEDENNELQPIENPMFAICTFGFYHLLQDYWASRIDVLPVNKRNRDLLSIAADYGHLNICEKLMELGSDVDRQLESHPNDSSALSIAVRADNIDIVRFLISQGADPNIPLNGPSALCASISHSKFGCTGILLEAKADPNHPCGPPCEFAYALENAAHKNNIEAMKLLLNGGADVTLSSKTGQYGSALEAAATAEHDGRFCRLLINHGADVNAPLRYGMYGSALAAAAGVYNKTACRLLIKHGADVNMPLKAGRYGSALAVAASKAYREICQLLIDHGADVNMPLKTGKYGSALAAAASKGFDKICQLLIDHGADVNASLEYGKYGSALAAAARGHSK